jgi:hypothetical protein
MWKVMNPSANRPHAAQLREKRSVTKQSIYTLLKHSAAGLLRPIGTRNWAAGTHYYEDPYFFITGCFRIKRLWADSIAVLANGASCHLEPDIPALLKFNNTKVGPILEGTLTIASQIQFVRSAGENQTGT